MKLIKSYKFLLLSLTLQLGIFSNVFSQNLIQNWSFEDTVPCFNNPDPYAPESALGWLSVCQSPDYGSDIYCGTYFIPFGDQIPHSGYALMGAGLYSEYAPNSIRETFGQQLNDTLIAGHTYCVSFYVSLSGGINFAIDRIGALFTSYQIDGNDIATFTLIPQVQNIPGNIISDTTNWILISGDFVAQGNETFVSFGNFYDDQNTQSMQLPWGDTTFSNSYYYFDDISVIDCTVGLPELTEIKFDVYPNPSFKDDEITISMLSENSGITDIDIYSIEGKALSKQSAIFQNGKFTFEFNFDSGVYFLKIENSKGIGVRKLVILN